MNGAVQRMLEAGEQLGISWPVPLDQEGVGERGATYAERRHWYRVSLERILLAQCEHTIEVEHAQTVCCEPPSLDQKAPLWLALSDVDRYRHEACQHGGWKVSNAKRFTDALHAALLNKLGADPLNYTERQEYRRALG